MRIMGLDYGSKTVGVAISDELLLTAQGKEIIRDISLTVPDEKLIVSYEVGKIVLGCPFNMDGTSGIRVEKTLAFKESLERRTGLPVILCDERLSTVEADEIMDEVGVRKQDRKKHVDKIAATIILQRYLDENGSKQ